MDKRAVLLSALGMVAAGTIKAAAQSPEMPSQKELVEILEDDKKFSLMLSAIWLLREILVLTQSPEDQEKDRGKFSGHLEVIGKSRTAIIDALKKYEYNFPIPDQVAKSLPRLASELEKAGVNPNSELSNRLIRSYAQVNQSLAATSDSSNSLCDTFPFGYFC